MRCEKVCPVNEINGSHLTGGQNLDTGGNSSSQVNASQASLVDGFYEKLSKSFESSGLSLLLLNMGNGVKLRLPCTAKASVSMSPTQLHKLYAQLLYQFELTYHYRTLAKVVANLQTCMFWQHSYILDFIICYTDMKDYGSASKFNGIGHPYGTENSSSCSTRKRKNCDNSNLSIVLFGPNDCPTKKKKCNDNSNQLSTVVIETICFASSLQRGASHSVHSLFWIEGPKLAAPKPDVQTSPKNKEMKKDPNAPIGSRSAYQMYLRKECDRLKKIHGETSGSHNIRNMAIDAWRCFSESDKQPYVEESRKDKERYNREMTAYKERKNMQPDGDYRVILQPTTEKFFAPDVSTVELPGKLMKNAQPNDSLLQINWDECCGSLDIPS
ncbi:hypothetical protein Acr_19g0001650 [Actinidia rufa]|uniref:HMG box domain-containing protein n=1 Tax=Actinidia rufa TaxID=165716 RepID=A0A7J0G947_9ERIC|nr:hypothetical protein Acr_19g0001650 [Actinidia rufa]